MLIALRAGLDLTAIALSVMLGVTYMRSPLWANDRRDRAVIALALCVGLLTLNSAAVNGLRWHLPPWLRVIEPAVIVAVVATINVTFIRERRELRRRLLARKEHKIERESDECE